MEYVLIIISAIFVNNIVLAKFLGVCPFMGVSTRLSTAFGMTAAVTFVMVLATVASYLIQNYLLVPYGIEFLQTIAFILVIASLVQLVEIVLKKVSKPLYQALGIFLPLITTNCAVLGVAILAVQDPNFGLIESVLFAAANAVGFGLALATFAGLREHMDIADIPAGMKGIPIAFVTAGLLALAFMGFAGIA